MTQESPMFYVAEDGDQPGAAFAACVDKPEFREANLKDMADWVKRGATIRHVDRETMLTMMKAWLPESRQLPLKLN